MKVQHSEVIVLLSNEQLCDIIFPHDGKGIDHQGIGINGFWGDGHDIPGSDLLEISCLFKHSAKIAIGDDPFQLSVVQNGCCSQSFDDISRIMVLILSEI